MNIRWTCEGETWNRSTRKTSGNCGEFVGGFEEKVEGWSSWDSKLEVFEDLKLEIHCFSEEVRIQTSSNLQQKSHKLTKFSSKVLNLPPNHFQELIPLNDPPTTSRCLRKKLDCFLCLAQFFLAHFSKTTQWFTRKIQVTRQISTKFSFSFPLQFTKTTTQN
jgi:hypothetical protein